MPKPQVVHPRPFGSNHEVTLDAAMTIPCSAVPPWTKDAQEAAHASGWTLAEIAAKMTELGCPTTAQRISLAFLNGRTRVSAFAGTFELALVKLGQGEAREQRLPADAAWVAWVRERMALHGLYPAALARRAGVPAQQIYVLLRGEGARSEGVAKINAVLEVEPDQPHEPKREPPLEHELERVVAQLDKLQTAHRQVQEQASSITTEMILLKRELRRILRRVAKSSSMAG